MAIMNDKNCRSRVFLPKNLLTRREEEEGSGTAAERFESGQDQQN
jgi:hypothetical protein